MSGIGSLVPFLLLVLLVWVPLNRYLQHKEVMLLLEKGGEETGGVWYALLETRERWRLRWGLLAGAAMTVLGIAMSVAIQFYMQTGAWSTGHMDAEALTTSVAVSMFLIIMGLITLLSHAMWARKRIAGSTGNESEKKA